MRVLFVDIDGVLNSRSYVQRAGWEPPLGTERDLQIIDPEAVALLNLVVEATGAHLVITSSWRATYEVDVLRSMLEQRGFSGRILGVTPELVGRQRSKEIARWLAECEREVVESFAIVDDEDDAGADHPPRFVQTTFDEGLTRTHALRLIALLKG